MILFFVLFDLVHQLHGEFASQLIDITGTKGKRTTSSLLYKVLSAASI